MFRRTSRIFQALTLVALASCALDPNDGDPPLDDITRPGPSDGDAPPPADAEYAPDSVIVRFRSRPTRAAARHAMTRVHGTITDGNGDGIYDAFAHIAKGELAMVHLDPGVSVDEALAQLRSDPDIAYAEPNYIVHALATPNDPHFGELYGLHNTGQDGGTPDADIDAVEAWDITVGSPDIVVAVIDSGVDYRHPDLQPNMWVNPGEIASNGIDDDGNGVIDDVHGFNAIDRSGDPFDDLGHGTHCAGIIGAAGNNGVGVVGVNWRTSIMALKFINAFGDGTNDGAIAAINYAIAQRKAGVNVRVLSNSWGNLPFSQAVQDAIAEANDAGMLFVAAAGNDSSDNDAQPRAPSSYDVPNVIAVAATDRKDNLARFSNFGATSVDLAAPGKEILSTLPGNRYGVKSGTSMATPHVAGVAALVLSVHPEMDTALLKDILLNSGDPLPALRGKVLSGRRLNANRALDDAAPGPRFRLDAAPEAQAVLPGQSATFTVDVASFGQSFTHVALTVSVRPALDASVVVRPDCVSVSGQAIVSITTRPTTAVGTYRLTITGTSGERVRSTTVSLRVRPASTIEIAVPSTDTPIAIPDEGPKITSVIQVEQGIDLEEVRVDLDITHTFTSDLVVLLTSPGGTTVTLNDINSPPAQNLHKTYVLSELTGQQTAGAWRLDVSDAFADETGTLDGWTLHFIGPPSAPGFAVPPRHRSRP